MAAACPGVPLTVTGLGSWAGKVSEYANPFDPNLDRTVSGAETTITSAPGWATGYAPSNGVSRADARNRVVRLQRGGATGAPGPATWVEYAAATPFTAKTVIAWQDVWTGFTGTMPYEVRLGTGPSPAWGTITPVVADDGTPGSGDILIVNTSGSYDALRVDFPQTAYYGGSWYADFQAVTVLPDTLQRIPGQSVVASSGSDWGNTASLTDMLGNTGWAKWTGTTPWYVTVGLGGAQDVDALMVYSFENVSVTFKVKDDANNEIALVTMDIGPYGWAVPIRFAEPLNTSSITLEFVNTDQVALREIIAFQKVAEPVLIPEPLTACMVAAGTGLALAARRRRRSPK